MAKTLIPNKGAKINIKNKRAEFDYLLMDKYTAGLVLTGTEIKSIRKGKASLVDTYCYVIGGEMWVKNMYIAHYEQGSYNNHVETVSCIFKESFCNCFVNCVILETNY